MLHFSIALFVDFLGECGIEIASDFSVEFALRQSSHSRLCFASVVFWGGFIEKSITSQECSSLPELYRAVMS